jgi:hypothetical protein
MNWGMVFSSTGFSLWVLVGSRTNPHRLKPVPLKTKFHPFQKGNEKLNKDEH